MKSIPSHSGTPRVVGPRRVTRRQALVWGVTGAWVRWAGAAAGAPAEPERARRPLLQNQAGETIRRRSAWSARRAELWQEWDGILGGLPRRKVPLKAQTLATEPGPGFVRRWVKYQVEDGVFTDAYLLTPTGVAGRRPAVVVFHPTVKTHARLMAGLDDSDPELAQGVQLVQRGYVVLCPRCFIFEEGADFAGNVARVRARHPGWTGMARMTWDGIRAADYLTSLAEVDGRRLGGLGHSLGAKEVLYAAAFDARYRATVFSEGGIGLRFSNWEAPWYLGPQIQAPTFPAEHHELLALIAPRAFLLLAGESADGERSGAFLAAAKPVYRLWGAEEKLAWLNHRQGHRYSASTRQVAEEFLDRHLRA